MVLWVLFMLFNTDNRLSAAKKERGNKSMKVLQKNGEMAEMSFEEQEGRKAFWHTSAHVLAQAVKHSLRIRNVPLVLQLKMDFIMILN